MRDTLLFFLAMFALTALVEFQVLRKWLDRRGVLFCVFSVAVFSGVLWLTSAMALFHIQWDSKVAGELPLSGSDLVGVVVFILIDFLILTVVALIPAGSVALIYRRVRSQR